MRIILIVFFAILIGLVIITITYAGCVEISNKIFDRAIRWGYSAKIVRGYHDGKYHQWVEYWHNNKWCVWDDAIWYIGKSRWTAEEIGYETTGTIGTVR